MSNNNEEDFTEDLNHETQITDEIVEESSLDTTRSTGLTERLREILGDGDLLMQHNSLENNVLQWLQALDLQVIGACRADERLKPLLKLNVSSGVAEDHLLAHLSQHFEVSEVGMLARCLCVPLVSIRVGKVTRQGTLLCPTATRGNLNLTLLPSSDLRISFVGDDGCTERLATLSSGSEVVIEVISADKSGRSFLMMLPGCQVSYFWCSELSQSHGFELLAKMKDLLGRNTSLSQLTGICESRLDCFASHLRAYLLASTVNNKQVNPTVSSICALDTAFDPHQRDLNTKFSSSKPSRARNVSGQTPKPHSLYQGSLSPRPNTFKDPTPRTSPIIRSGIREKFKRNSESSPHKSLSVALTSKTEASSSSSKTEKESILEVSVPQPHPPSTLSFLESLGSSVFPPFSNTLSLDLSLPQLPATSSLFSPYYCWCPPSTSTLQYTITPLNLPISNTQSLSLPPLSSLLSDARSSSSLGQSMDFPIFLPDPIARLPRPVSSFITMPNLQQVPTFTPLMCDPIVHIPVIDVCSSSGYFVSAGPNISSTIIPPLCPNLVNPLIPDSESAAEKGARETLRMLIGQTNQQFTDVFPPVLTSAVVVGSRGFYSGNREVEAISNSIAAMGLISVTERAVRVGVTERDNSSDDIILGGQQAEGSGDFEGLTNFTLFDDTLD
ncbi:hypothetical protein GIB67_027369 [Kingdonia uniflora]|uniref:Uncharacterized protein n=1 Tax=Kingdonia uniflora TaxID=39325 RepID=A0A7J7MFB0_9MAGN|nr:hypothetical protein GIB67_027369 [Kingdonia uniflora]